MGKQALLYEGKAKKLYKTGEEGVLWVEYLNQATALNGAKKDEVLGKGELNNQITSKIFEKLKKFGILSHFIEKVSKTEQLVKEVTIVPLEVVVRNVAAGSFSKRLDVPEGQPLKFPIVEFYYKEDRLDDPLINEDHILALEIATTEQIQEIKTLTQQLNQALLTIFKELSIRLIDFKVEFGLDSRGKILLADEISPDTCRLWDLKTNEHLDKDIYRRDLGDIVPVYKEVLRRLEEKE
ncbi:phosphoribosylaminoimidazolesuccinocarboxamide synthase [Enterococcus sp. AZ194]|uniref:phosphoribosylaminoimidazolesuccinocarboxamide synthase n=1 Tax=Enterococcus sp. AZ194 TaxID=2774629 RepID=UPI003F25F5F2